MTPTVEKMKAETVRNFWRRGYAAEETAEALALPLEQVRAIYEEMDAWKEGLRARRGSVGKTTPELPPQNPDSASVRTVG